MTIKGFSDPMCCVYLQEEVKRLTRINDVLMGRLSQQSQQLKDDHHLIIVLREMVDSLRKEVARLASSPQWERERDCYDVNNEYTN